MAYGLTPQGLNIKRLPVIKSEKENAARVIFGAEVNLDPSEPIGQWIGAEAEREATIWQLAQECYNACYPNSASGISLDGSCALTGTPRNGPTASHVYLTCYGTLATIIPVGSAVSQKGNPVVRFVTTTEGVIAAGTNEVQDIDFSSVPDAGAFALVYNGETTALLAYTSSAADVQTALNNLSALSGVTVSGNFTAGFTVTFAGADGQKSHPTLMVGSNTLANSGNPVGISILKTTSGAFPNCSVYAKCEILGAISALAGTLTVMETVVIGWDSVTNLADADIGKNVETNAEYRLRREQTLARPGSSTDPALQAALLDLDEVEAAIVYSNRGDSIDLEGRPPHSFECVVRGAADEVIANAIWTNMPSGIQPFGNVHEVIQDSNGYDQDIYFSRPVDKNIYVEITLVTNSKFPLDGLTTVRDSVLAYAEASFGVSDDVITDWLYCPINCVPGIEDITITIGLTPSPTTDVKVPIGQREVSAWDSSRILVTAP